MDLNSIVYALLGGGLIGVAVTMMLLFNGRVTGISGILSSALGNHGKDDLWRWFFLSGMVIGGFFMTIVRPDFFTNLSNRSTMIVMISGLLVGYGTVMGSGCTSGHGVCGISRFSMRSIVSTITFMLFGFFAVQLMRYLLGDSI